ncbi:MAG: hypothetical protein GXP29_02940 [Planctomycetes bacterium]|nr:hypothetical protein [Planctomycetota bacterium]
MKKKLCALGGALTATIIVLAAQPQVALGSMIDLLGEQDFADGMNPIFASEIAAEGAGEPFPFDGTVFGNDLVDDSLGSFSYTHTFDLGGEIATFAELTIGLIDHDSFNVNFPFSTIDLFFDGVQQPDGVFTGISARPSSVSVVSVPVPMSFLMDGELTVEIIATTPGTGSDGNSIAPDFSALEIRTIPEPATVVMFALCGIALLRKP